MTGNTTNKPVSFTLRAFIGLAALGLTLSFMRQASSLINPLILSIIIVLSASPLLYWLKRKGAPDWLAFVLTLTTIFVIFGALIAMVVVAVDRLVDAVPMYAAQLDETISSVQEFLDGLGLSGVGLDDFIALIDPGAILASVANLIAGLIGAISDVVLVGLIVIFLVVDAFNMPAKIASEINMGNTYVMRLASFSADIRQYVAITTVVGLVTGFFDTLLFLAVGVDFAVLWGILAFLLSYIPTIGFWLAAIPPTFLALLESGPLAALVVFLGIVLINGFAENVVKPKYMGSGLNLTPFIVIFSVIFWSAILGPLGAILSIPMTLIIKELILEVDDQNRWMADLMSAEVPEVDLVVEEAAPAASDTDAEKDSG